MANQKIEPKPCFIDVFAGCGGLSLGLMKAGWRGLFAIEKDAFAFETLKTNLITGASPGNQFDWPEWLSKDAHGVTEFLDRHSAELELMSGKVDMLVGGPPCQGFSSAGRRDPSDPRNQLVNAYLRLVALIRPKIVLIENVRGITQDFDDADRPSGKVNYAAWITASLSEEYVVSTKMIDTSTFGVPQRRQRFFVIAIRKDLDSSVNPFQAIEARRAEFLRDKGIDVTPVSARAAISDLEINGNGVAPSRDTKGFEEIAYGAPASAYQKLLHDGAESMSDLRLARHSLEITGRFQEIIEYCHANSRLSVSLSRELNDNFGLKKCAIRVLDPNGPAPTITSMPDDLIHYSEPRTLTVRETARIQSFPDTFTFHGKYTTGGHRRKREVPRFTQVANAVPPLVAEGIGLALLTYVSTKPVEKVQAPSRVAQRYLGTQVALV